MTGAGDFLESFSVACPRCDCDFKPELRPTSYFAHCPDCKEPVRVPAGAEVEDDWKREQAASEGDTYRLSIPTDWDDGPSLQSAALPTDAKPTPGVHKEPQGSRPAEDDLEELEPLPEAPAAAPKATCPACGANFEATPSQEPQIVLCPECLEDVEIPPLTNLPQRPPASEPPSLEAAEKPAAEKKKGDSKGSPRDFYLTDAASDDSLPKKTKKRKKKSKSKPSPPENPTRPGRPEKHVDDVLAEIRQVEKDPPPEWTFFSGVVDFLFRPSVIVRWIFASIGFCLMGWLTALCLHFYETDYVMAMPFFVLPLIWIGFMSLAYAASCSMPILLETAAGNDKVGGWPEPVLKEQAVDMVYLCFLLIVVGVVCYFLEYAVRIFSGPPWLVRLTLTFLLYPIVLLSSLEANSPYVPLTLPIIKSIQKVAWAWGVFYGLSLGLACISYFPLKWLFAQSGWTQFFGMIFLAPIVAGSCFLYARLLGRLAWRASLEVQTEDEEEEAQDENGKKAQRKGKKKKPKVSESSGELQAAR